MVEYEYGRIKVLATKLAEAGIAKEIVDQILEGGEGVRKNALPVRKAEWMKDAMNRMDTLLDKETRQSVREACACCLGGKRLEISRNIAKANQTIEDRISAANEARFVFGHSVSLEPDGKILVCFMPEESIDNRCVCMPKADGPVSITYCYCCGGHVKHHLQIALGRKLRVVVRSSALASEGKKPCTFLFAIDE